MLSVASLIGYTSLDSDADFNLLGSDAMVSFSNCRLPRDSRRGWCQFRTSTVLLSICVVTLAVGWWIDRHGEDVRDFLNKPSGSRIRKWTNVGARQWIFHSNRKIEATLEMQPGCWLRSPEKYGDFRLTLDYQLKPGGSGGVFLRVPTDSTWPWNDGVDLHFCDDYGQSVSNESTGAIWHKSAPIENAGRKTGEWNTVVIECRARQVVAIMNGRVVMDYRLDERIAAQGNICLDGIAGGITYRNIVVEQL